MLFKDLDLGPDDAKGDTRLAEYFIRTPEYDRVRSGAAAFVIGRKGTGKTAICQMIHDEAQNTPTLFSALLSFKNSPTNELFQSADQTYNSPNEYISIWKFLIAYEAAKLILKDESIDNQTRHDLQTFLQETFGTSDVSPLDAVGMLKDRSWRVSLKLPSKYLPSGEVARSSSDAYDQHIHFGRAATALMRRITSVQSTNTFFIIFDELDEDYRIEGRYFDLIISLLKATYQTRCEISPTLELRPVVVLREDIFLQLDDHDLNKIDDLLIHLRWNADSTTHEFSLRGLINQRFRANLADTRLHEGADDLWPQFVNENDWQGPYSSAWEFFALRTMARPRDIIKALKCCQSFEQHETLGPVAVQKASRAYSDWLSKEIGNEMFRVVPEYRLALSLLRKLGSVKFDAPAWREVFSHNVVLAQKYSPDAVLERLFEFGVVGTVLGKKLRSWTFKYTNPHINFDIGGMFGLHPGLYDFLAIPVQRVVSKQPELQPGKPTEGRQKSAPEAAEKNKEKKKKKKNKNKNKNEKKNKKKKKKNKKKKEKEIAPQVASGPKTDATQPSTGNSSNAHQVGSKPPSDQMS